ncbi:hypothetical protein FGB62_1g679 [Gracilaria domingensis]|nr:hypothetical protein FGB62_1g679 [Gracilaria domingensis]
MWNIDETGEHVTTRGQQKYADDEGRFRKGSALWILMDKCGGDCVRAEGFGMVYESLLTTDRTFCLNGEDAFNGLEMKVLPVQQHGELISKWHV